MSGKSPICQCRAGVIHDVASVVYNGNIRIKDGKLMKAPFAIAAGVASIVGMISTSMADPSVGLSKVYESTTAGAPESIVYDAVSAMSFFRTLTGQWNNSPMEGDRAGGSAATAHVTH